VVGGVKGGGVIGVPTPSVSALLTGGRQKVKQGKKCPRVEESRERKERIVFACVDGREGEGTMAPLPAHIEGEKKKLVAKEMCLIDKIIISN
jgi:hypothetical protein